MPTCSLLTFVFLLHGVGPEPGDPLPGDRQDLGGGGGGRGGGGVGKGQRLFSYGQILRFRLRLSG